jgi:hypothetical protein
MGREESLDIWQTVVAHVVGVDFSAKAIKIARNLTKKENPVYYVQMMQDNRFLKSGRNIREKSDNLV